MMTISATDLAAHELIGLSVTVSGSSDPTKIGITGIVGNETKNTLTIQVRDRFILIPKNGSKFSFELPAGDRVVLEGSTIQFRPEDRIKRGQVRW